jgi:hypothetical protein
MVIHSRQNYKTYMKRVISTFAILVAAITVSLAQAPVKTVTGNLTGNVNWSVDTIYKLQGKVYLKSGATLNIAPGTIINCNQRG